MIDVIDPTAPGKYGDVAESNPGDGNQVAGMVTGVNTAELAQTPPQSGSGSARTFLESGSSILSVLTANNGTSSSLNARGRAVTFCEEDDDELPEEEEEESYCEEDEEDEEEERKEEREKESGLKASLLDYVLSEVANHHQQMDLEVQPVVVSKPLRRKYAFNPEEPQDVPPHLSEYYDGNVIAVLNRCDPRTWGRCLSCGSGNDLQQQQQQQQQIQYELEKQQQQSIDQSMPFKTVTAQGVNGREVYEIEAFWNYYNYKSDYRTNSTPVAYHYHQQNQQQPACGIQYQSENSAHLGMISASGVNGGYFGDANYQVERMRCNSDSGNTNTSSDLDNNGQPSQNGGGVEMEEGEEVFTFDASLLSEAFLSSGRVDHSIQLMAYHPDYLEIFLRTQHFLMRSDGPLPYNNRNYIAIMAAARYRCSYLMELQKREFLYQGGDPKWLLGLDCAPPKLRALYNINKVMAHRPWVLKQEDLEHLTKKSGWSLSEVVQAVVILAHFHSLSSFIHGCGITPEVDFDNGHTFLMTHASNPAQNTLHHHQSPSITQASEEKSPLTVTSGTGSPHTTVSFAVGPPSILTTTNSLSHSQGSATNSPPKQATKSILKKTEHHHHLSTSPASSTSSSSSSNSSSSGANTKATGLQAGSINSISGGINVPNSVHFHPYHHPNHHHHSSTSPGNSFASSPVLKSDTLHNSLCGGGSLATSPPRASSTVSEVDIIMATMKNLSETSPIEDPEERKKRFETVARSDLDAQMISDPNQKENIGTTLGKILVTGPGFASQNHQQQQNIHNQQQQIQQNQQQYITHKSMLPPDVTPFIAEPEYTYEDFAKRGQVSELHTFRIQDYSWEEHGFSLVNRLYADVGQILDDKFKVAQNMTYYTIGGRANVDTTKFRTAVWNYIQCLYGIRHDDYDYGEVNQLLERPLKAFIKTVCCYPERITKQDYDNVMREFKHSEKVHVNLMIMEAKLQAELLYVLRTVMKSMIN